MAQKKQSPNIDTREKLLHAAARSFGVQGYAATTMRSIADEAGIEAASIYYHFSSKEDLVEEVMVYGGESIVRHLKAQVEALGPDADATARFRAAVTGQMSAMVKYGDYALASGRLLTQLPEGVRLKQVKRRETHQQLWSQLLEALRSEGFLRPDVDIHLCRVFLLACINSTQTWFNSKKGSIEDVADQLCAMFFEGVGTKRVR